jgi:hypothetical protein
MSEPMDFSRYRTQGPRDEVVAVDVARDRAARRRLMVIKIKSLAELARHPWPDRASHLARVEQLQDDLYELTIMEFEPRLTPTQEEPTP